MPTDKSRSPLTAIRKNCVICSGGSSEEVRLCPITDCPLYKFRFGKMPETAEKHFEKLKARKLSRETTEKTKSGSDRALQAKEG